MERDLVGEDWANDILPHVIEDIEQGAFEMFTVGTKVIRKSDASSAAQLFGNVTQVGTKKVRVFWEYSRQHSTLAISALKEVTPELEQELEAKAKAEREAKRIEWEAEHIYLCTNVNPLARVSNDGHKKPLRLSLGQTVDQEGKLCWYCKHPVILREQA